MNNNKIANALKYLNEDDLNNYVYYEFIKPLIMLPSSDAHIIYCYKIAVYEMNKALKEDYFELRVRNGHDLYVAAKDWRMPCDEWVFGK